MDLNLVRAVITVVSLVLFVGIWVWAWRSSNRAQFDEAAQLPLRGDPTGYRQ